MTTGFSDSERDSESFGWNSHCQNSRIEVIKGIHPGGETLWKRKRSAASLPHYEKRME